MAKEVKNPHGTLTFRPSKGNENLLAHLAILGKKTENRNLNNYIETILLGVLSANGVDVNSPVNTDICQPITKGV